MASLDPAEVRYVAAEIDRAVLENAHLEGRMVLAAIISIVGANAIAEYRARQGLTYAP